MGQNIPKTSQCNLKLKLISSQEFYSDAREDNKQQKEAQRGQHEVDYYFITGALMFVVDVKTSTHCLIFKLLPKIVPVMV